MMPPTVGTGTSQAVTAIYMVVLGAGKRQTLARMRAAQRYDPAWPATLIHECPAGEIVCDAAAAEADPHA